MGKCSVKFFNRSCINCELPSEPSVPPETRLDHTYRVPEVSASLGERLATQARVIFGANELAQGLR